MARKCYRVSFLLFCCSLSIIAVAAKRIEGYYRPPPTLLITIRQGDNSSESTNNTYHYHTNTYRTQSRQDAHDQQQVQVMDGHQAYIDVGQAIPLPDNYYGGYFRSAGIRYKDVTSGFYVTPHLQGHQAVLHIERQQQRLDPYGQGRILINRVSTQVTVLLGKWVQIAGYGIETQNQRNVRLYKTTEKKRSESAIYVKVDVLDPRNSFRNGQ